MLGIENHRSDFSIKRKTFKLGLFTIFMKISRKYANITFIFLTAVFMSFLMSLIVTFINLGLIDGFVLMWLKAWGFSFVISYPVASIVLPVARKMVYRAVG